MTSYKNRKLLAKEKLHVAIENFKLAELDGAESLAPITFNWAKKKIYQSRKILLNPISSEQMQKEAIEDVSAACAQLLSIIQDKPEEDLFKVKEFADKEAINNFINEGGMIL